ncbi:hypothetical protein [Asticcacaulis solisilvae]|uniref:hypothetical protein n=1 Tax=Asticcacaulis solisilvae TaxID=1217274 RepID=UPI003FD75192
MDTATGPIIELSPNGGFRVTLNGVSGEGATIADALAQCQAATARTHHSEKGDETLQAQTAQRQRDILSNDGAMLNNQFQFTLMGGGPGFGRFLP